MENVSTQQHELRLKLIKALGEASKNTYSPIASDALKELKEIKDRVFEKKGMIV